MSNVLGEPAPLSALEKAISDLGDANQQLRQQLQPAPAQSPAPTQTAAPQELIAQGLTANQAARQANSVTLAASAHDPREAFIEAHHVPSGLRGFIGNDPARWADEGRQVALLQKMQIGHSLTPTENILFGLGLSRPARP